MNLNEVKALLKEVATIDNRKLSEEVAVAWHAIIGFMPYEIATEALHLARKDDRINWLEPKHIVSWAKEAAYKLDRESEKPKPAEYKYDPQPKCRDHNKLIISCDPCCNRIAKWEEAHGTQGIAEFAKKEIYA